MVNAQKYHLNRGGYLDRLDSYIKYSYLKEKPV